MIRFYRAPELPADVPGLVATTGDDTAVLLNPAFDGDPIMPSVLDALVLDALEAEVDTTPATRRATA